MSGKSEDRGNESPIPQYLRDALQGAQHNHQRSLETLRVAMCEYVDDLREKGISFKDVMKEVHVVIAELDGKLLPRSPSAAQMNDRTVDMIVRWCTDHWEQSK